MTKFWIRKQSLHGALWLSGAGAAISMSNIVIFAIVAKFVKPAEFGIVAFAIVLIEFIRFGCLSVITDAMIAKATADDLASTTAFWTAMAGAAISFLLCVFVGAPLMDHYYANGAGAIFGVLALSLLLEAPRCVHEGLLKRSFEYRAIALRMAAASLAGGLIAVLCALSGFGGWALVIQRIGSSAIQLAVSWRILSWRPGLCYSLEEARKLFEFCVGSGLGRVVGLIGDRMPEAIIGVVVGAEALGFYRIAMRGLDAVSQLVIQPTSGVALSALARVSDGARETQFLRIVGIVGIVAVPSYLGAGMIAPEFVGMIFGSQWNESAFVMSILGFLAAPCILSPLIVQLILSAAKPRELTLLSWINFLLVSGSVFCGAFISLPGAAIAQVLGSHASLAVAIRIASKSVGVSPIRLARTLGPALIAGMSMVAGLLVLRHFTGEQTPLQRIAEFMIVGGSLYFFVLMVFFRGYLLLTLSELKPLLPSKFLRYIPA